MLEACKRRKGKKPRILERKIRLRHVLTTKGTIKIATRGGRWPNKDRLESLNSLAEREKRESLKSSLTNHSWRPLLASREVRQPLVPLKEETLLRSAYSKAFYREGRLAKTARLNFLFFGQLIPIFYWKFPVIFLFFGTRRHPLVFCSTREPLRFLI